MLVRTERNYLTVEVGSVLLSWRRGARQDIGPVSVNVFIFSQRLKASSGMNSGVKVKTN